MFCHRNVFTRKKNHCIEHMPGGYKEEKNLLLSKVEEVLNIFLSCENCNVFMSGDFNIDLVSDTDCHFKNIFFFWNGLIATFTLANKYDRDFAIFSVIGISYFKLRVIKLINKGNLL